MVCTRGRGDYRPTLWSEKCTQVPERLSDRHKGVPGVQSKCVNKFHSTYVHDSPLSCVVLDVSLDPVEEPSVGLKKVTGDRSEITEELKNTTPKRRMDGPLTSTLNLLLFRESMEIPSCSCIYFNEGDGLRN